MTSIPEYTETEIHAELQTSPVPVLVYFISPYCAPCKMLTPIVEQLTAEWANQVRVVKFDVFTHMLAALRFGVMSAPELILFKGGQPVVRLHGFAPKPKIIQTINPHL